MRIFLSLLMSIAIVSAQSDVGKILGRGVVDEIAGLTPVPEADKSELLEATALLLRKHVTFRPDGTASSIHTFSERQHVDWKGLVVKFITTQAVNDADRLNGVSKRYAVSFSCDAHRSWDLKTNAWGQWLPIRSVIFPAGLTFELKASQWTAAPSFQLSHFIPGPGPSVADPKSQPAQTSGLPPGMTKSW